LRGSKDRSGPVSKDQLNIITLDHQSVAFGVDLSSGRPGDTSQVFAMSAKQNICSLEVVKDDPLDEPSWLFSWK
jgi:hypothetical protein